MMVEIGHLIFADLGSDILTKVTAEAKDGTAFFEIRGRIGLGDATALHIGSLVAGFRAKGITKAKVFISSPGGSVFEMNDIISELDKFGPENIELEAGAVVASAATMPFTRYKSTARPNSQFMIHKPMLPAGGNEDEVTSALELLKNITSEYRTAYATKMGITEDAMEAMWKQNKWLTAKQALDMKLVSSIAGNELEITAEVQLELVACGAPNTQITKKNKMDKEELIALLGLAADATDDQIQAAIKANKEKAKAHDAAEKDATKDLKAKAEQAVMAAITAKKILATQKDDYMALFTASPEATAKVLDSLPEIDKLSAALQRDKNTSVEAERKDWTMDDYLDKDPQAYEKMREDDPERAERLENEYFNSKD